MQAGADEQAAGSAAEVELDDLPAPWLHALVHSLEPADKLCLFQASKQLTVAVLQQAAHVQLTLTPSRGISWQRTVQPILAAAPANTLHVVLTGGIPAAYASLPLDRITHLSLQKFPLKANHLRRKLHLAACIHLHTLTLGEGCNRGVSPKTAVQLQQQFPPRLPPALRSLNVWRSMDQSATAVARYVLQLLHPQLTTLKFFGNPYGWSDLDARPLPSLPQLTHFSTTGQLADCNVAQLLTAPALTHVEAVFPDHPAEAPDYSKKACTWQQLRLTAPLCSLEGLSRLPLAGIQRVIIHGVRQLDHGPAVSDHQVASLSACAGLQCDGVWYPALQQPVFRLGAISSPGLISLCASRVVTPGTCLQLSTFRSQLTGLPAVLRQLPRTITALWFGGGLPASLVPEMPAHITLLVVEERPGVEAAVDQLMAALEATAGHDHVAVGVVLWERRDTPPELQQLLAKYGERVRLLPYYSK